MQTYLFFIFLITQCVKSAEVDCGDINPTSAADCKLSEMIKIFFFHINIVAMKKTCLPLNGDVNHIQKQALN